MSNVINPPTLLECPICDDRKLYKGERGLKIHCSRQHIPRIVTSSAGHNDPNLVCLDGTPSNENFCTKLAFLKNNCKIFKRVPKGARATAARSFSACVAKVVSLNSSQAWEDLLTFSYRSFHIVGNHNNRSLSSIIKNNLSQSISVLPIVDSKGSNNFSKIKLIENKISDGNINGAAKLLFSSDTIAPNSSDTISTLRDKHPSSPTAHIPIIPSHTINQFLTVDPVTVFNAIRSFPNGSAGGLDGITPQHLKDLTDPFLGDPGKNLIRELTDLVNLILSGLVPTNITPILFGANLVALKKKDGGIRPIAVGNTIRRLVSKICCREFQPRLSSMFQPKQLGFGVRGGCEAAVHAARTFLQSSDFDIFVKLDVQNAFNSVDRASFLMEVERELPEISKYLFQAYGAPSKLFFGDTEIESCVGCQQGDPLGPVLFSLAINPIIQKLISKFNLWYLDDGSLAGNASSVLQDLNTITSSFKNIGLKLNFNKCEIYFSEHINPVTKLKFLSDFNNLAPNISVSDKFNLSLLGAPIFIEAFPDHINSKLEKFQQSSDLLYKIKPHMALFILRLCLFTPKFMYLLRCCNFWQTPNLIDPIDIILKSTLTKILNLQFDDRSWRQATLPIRFGGLGIRTASSVALPAFLASTHSTLTLISNILNLSIADVRVSGQADARALWITSFPRENVPLYRESQRQWDTPQLNSTFACLLDLSNDSDKARLLAVSQKESGYWLHSLPSTNIGTLLEASVLRIAICLRLGAKICESHFCRSCGCHVDILGRHGLSCVRSAGRIYRHATLNDTIRRALATAAVPAKLEPSGLSRDDGKRPDGVTLVPWRLGRALVWDVTCVDTLAPSHIPSTRNRAGAAAENAQTLKRRKYSRITDNYEFAALAVETMGPWSSDTKSVVEDIGKRMVLASGDLKARDFFAQRLSLIIQRGNAASIMGTMDHLENLLL